MADSPVDQLLERLRASLNVQRRDAVTRVQLIRAAADAYLSAVEADVVREFASTHGFGHDPKPKGAASAAAAAATLLELVSALPELSAPAAPAATGALSSGAGKPASASAAPAAVSAPRAAASPPAPTPKAAVASPQPGPSGPRPALNALGHKRPLVVVGRLGKKDRLVSLEAELPPNLEWLDTNQNGMAAIGNLERRLRERRVGALVLVEGSLGHKHTEPLISAARQFDIPFAYANKGGKASILRALDEIEATLKR